MDAGEVTWWRQVIMAVTELLMWFRGKSKHAEPTQLPLAPQAGALSKLLVSCAAPPGALARVTFATKRFVVRFALEFKNDGELEVELMSVEVEVRTPNGPILFLEIGPRGVIAPRGTLTVTVVRDLTAEQLARVAAERDPKFEVTLRLRRLIRSAPFGYERDPTPDHQHVDVGAQACMVETIPGM